MKNLIPALALWALCSCNNNGGSRGGENDTLTADSVYSWQATLNDSTGRLEMKKTEAAGPDSLDIFAVVRFINNSNANIKMEWVKTSNDTAYLKIADATYLTQQMGSTGAQMWLAAAVFNLTEIPGVRYVNFDFEEGDHAGPGTYDRNSFKDE